MKPTTIMIATVYSYEPVLTGVLKLGADILHLLIDPKPNKEQETGIREIEKILGNIVQIKKVATSVYDIAEVAKSVVEIMDSYKGDESIILNISAARKPKSLGLLFAGYARPKKIKKIIYVTKEDKEIIYLPILSFNLNQSQGKILADVRENPASQRRFYDIGISRSMYYKTIKELRDLGFLDENNSLTAAGVIALL